MNDINQRCADQCPHRTECARASKPGESCYTRLLVTDLQGRCVNFVRKQ